MKAFKKIVCFLGVAIIIAVFVFAFIAYFIFSFDPINKKTYDGLGRLLSDSPWFVRLIFGQERLWPGWKWFLADMVIFWGSLSLGAGLVSYGFKD